MKLILSSLLFIASASAITINATTCAVSSGQSGFCISRASCKSGTGVSESGHCPGDEDIQCCTYGSCKVSGTMGWCQPLDACTSPGNRTAGLCPGPDNVQCCTGTGVCQGEGDNSCKPQSSSSSTSSKTTKTTKTTTSTSHPSTNTTTSSSKSSTPATTPTKSAAPTQVTANAAPGSLQVMSTGLLGGCMGLVFWAAGLI